MNSELERQLAAHDADLEKTGQDFHRTAQVLFAQSRVLRQESVGPELARCSCWWETASDEADAMPDKARPLWARFADRAVTYDTLAFELGGGHVPNDGSLCDPETCACPFYDEHGEPRG